MVTVTNYRVVQSEEGSTYIRLELSGGLQVVQSQSSGLHYATSRNASIACTLSEDAARSMIGTVLDGEIEKVDCPAYDYQLDTGETIELTHRWVFVPAEERASVAEAA